MGRGHRVRMVPIDIFEDSLRDAAAAGFEHGAGAAAAIFADEMARAEVVERRKVIERATDEVSTVVTNVLLRLTREDGDGEEEGSQWES